MKRFTPLRVFFVLLFISYFLFNIDFFDIYLSRDRIEVPIYKNAKKEDVFIYIDVPAKVLYLYQQGELVKKYTIATGKEDTPTPLGCFKIIKKGDWGEGFGGYWMGLDVPWGIYGIHGTNRPDSIGQSASHGCIRMRSEDAEEIYKKVKVGTRVEISGGAFGPFGSGFRDIYPGDRGADVLEIQRVLKHRAYYGGDLDGKYGLSMEKAIYKFQQDNGLILNNIITKDMYKQLGIILMD